MQLAFGVNAKIKYCKQMFVDRDLIARLLKQMIYFAFVNEYYNLNKHNVMPKNLQITFQVFGSIYFDILQL